MSRKLPKCSLTQAFGLDTDSDYSPRGTSKKKRVKSIDSPTVSDSDTVRKKRKRNESVLGTEVSIRFKFVILLL